MTLDEKLKLIDPAKNYPKYVRIETKAGTVIEYRLHSYCLGLYISVSLNGSPFEQGASSKPTETVKTLLNVIQETIKLGETVEIGEVAEFAK